MDVDTQKLFTEGITAARAGDRERARALFIQLVELEERNEMAWLWLSELVADRENREICLENVLTINPDNRVARKSLEALRGRPLPSAEPAGGETVPALDAVRRADTIWLVGAFWTGISIVFGIGSIVSLLQLVQGQELAFLITPMRVSLVLIALIFLSAGAAALSIAVQVLLRKPGGFYGSLLFGLALVAVAPICSLLSEPPNYLGGTLVAFLPALIFLLTLLSRHGFER
jgi:hypothetical protein